MTATYLRHALDDSRVIELRAEHGGRWASGLFDSHSILADTARIYGTECNLFTTLNRPHKTVSATNTMTGRAVRGTDIAAITRLPIDFDPVRPTGMPSTDAELKLAVRARNKLVAMLGGLQWPRPATALSGNGAHCLFRCLLPNSDATAEMLRAIYTGLKRDFSDELVRFDATVRNPARIWRLYGSRNRKGADTLGRPHRMSSVNVPPRWDGVSPKQVEQLASSYARRIVETRIPAPRPARACGAGDYSTLDVAAWFGAHAALKRRITDHKIRGDLPLVERAQHAGHAARQRFGGVARRGRALAEFPLLARSLYRARHHRGDGIVGRCRQLLRSCLAAEGVVILRDYQQKMAADIRAMGGRHAARARLFADWWRENRSRDRAARRDPRPRVGHNRAQNASPAMD